MKRSRVRWPRFSRAGLSWGVAIASAVALKVWLHLQITEAGYQLNLLHQLFVRLGAERSELEAELATLTSPRSLDAIARKRLGLQSPREGQIVGLP